MMPILAMILYIGCYTTPENPNGIALVDCDCATGKLAFKARSAMPGSWPRDFLFIPGTDFAVVAMERSGTLLTVRYDAKTGAFTPVDSLHGLHRPVAVLD